MASLRTIKRRIRSVKSISEITKAMEMISTVRFKRVETRYRKSQPYFLGLTELIGRILSEEAVAGNPLFEKRELRRDLVIIVTGDRGLCGSFNTNVLRRAEICSRESAGREIEFYSVGKVGTGFMKRRGWKLWDVYTDLGYRFTPASLAPVVEKLKTAFLSGAFDRIRILASDVSWSGVPKVILEDFLSLSHFLDEKKKTPAAELDYIFEPDRRTTLETLIELYIKQKLFSVFLRSVTAEYNARRIAMKLATDNGKDLLKELTLERNKIRQAMITKEISEIIGGVNALN